MKSLVLKSLHNNISCLSPVLCAPLVGWTSFLKKNCREPVCVKTIGTGTHENAYVKKCMSNLLFV